MTQANIKTINWNKIKWQDYAKLIKNVSFNMGEQIAKEAFEKYTTIVIDGESGAILFGKSRITDQWFAMDTIRNYELQPQQQ